MAQAGFTPISLYYSSTASAVPVNTNLADGELAINITDGKLYYKDNAGTVQIIATKDPIVSSTTSITSPLAWNSDNFNIYAATAQASNFTINADAGTPANGEKIIFRITSDATPRVVTFTGGASKAFKPVGVTLTVSGSDFTYTLTASKTTYFGAIYNAASDRWEIVALSQET
jgi:hypothetical protein